MLGQSGFLPPRGLVPAEEQEAAASGSGQLRQQLRVVAGRRESLKPTTARRVCSACDRTRFPPTAQRGWPLAGFLWISAEETATQAGPGWEEEVAGAGSRAS